MSSLRAWTAAPCWTARALFFMGACASAPACRIRAASSAHHSASSSLPNRFLRGRWPPPCMRPPPSPTPAADHPATFVATPSPLSLPAHQPALPERASPATGRRCWGHLRGGRSPPSRPPACPPGPESSGDGASLLGASRGPPSSSPPAGLPSRNRSFRPRGAVAGGFFVGAFSGGVPALSRHGLIRPPLSSFTTTTTPIPPSSYPTPPSTTGGGFSGARTAAGEYIF